MKQFKSTNSLIRRASSLVGWKKSAITVSAPVIFRRYSPTLKTETNTIKQQRKSTLAALFRIQLQKFAYKFNLKTIIAIRIAKKNNFQGFKK